jgi:hypothetical protein
VDMAGIVAGPPSDDDNRNRTWLLSASGVV